MASYDERKEYAHFKLTDALIETRLTLTDIDRQRWVELQDDWDDALLTAYYQVDEAVLHLQRALEALKEGC